MAIHQFISNLRKKLDISQEEISRLLDMSRPTYSQIESGERELTISEAEKLASIFGLSLIDLMGGRDKKTIDVVLEKNKKPFKELCDEMKMRNNIPQIKVDKSRLEKFKQVLLYILDKVGAKFNVGETVIYKLLYLIDFDYYEKFEEQLIGATYIKNHYGPTPVEFKKIVDIMIKERQLETYKSTHFNYTQKKYIPLVKPDISMLSAIEIKLIDEVLAKHADKTASELSEYSHLDVPWAMTEQGQPIDYEAVFYRTKETSVRTYHDDD